MNLITIYTKETCPYCDMAKQLLVNEGVVGFNEIRIDLDNNHVWTVTVFDNEVDQMQSLFSEDANCSDGILADTEFDVLSFIEDEIIMLLPISPRHEKCDVQ